MVYIFVFNLAAGQQNKQQKNGSTVNGVCDCLWSVISGVLLGMSTCDRLKPFTWVTQHTCMEDQKWHK